MLFNISENMTTIVDVFNLANSFTGNILGLLIFIVIVGGLFFITSSFGAMSQLVSGGFVASLLSVMLSVMGLLNPAIAVVVSIITVGALIGLVIRKEGGM